MSERTEHPYPVTEESIYITRKMLKRALYMCFEYVNESQREHMKQHYPEEALVCMVNSVRYGNHLAEET